MTRNRTEDHRHKSHGFLSSTTETNHDEVHRNEALGTSLSGKTITMTSGQDMQIKGSTIAREEKVTLQAGGRVEILAAEETDREIHQKQVKKSGLFFGGGLGFTIGKEKKKDAYGDTATEQVGSIPGSIKGTIMVKANDDVHVKTLNVIVGKDIALERKNVSIENKDNVYISAESHKYKKCGFSFRYIVSCSHLFVHFSVANPQ